MAVIITHHLPDKELVSARDVMRRLGIGRTTLYHWVRAGLIPTPVVIRSRNYWNPIALRAHLMEAAPRLVSPFDNGVE